MKRPVTWYKDVGIAALVVLLLWFILIGAIITADIITGETPAVCKKEVDDVQQF